MDQATVLNYFATESVVDHYAQAAAHVGLWRSEEMILTRVFKPNDTLLELGCGAGRIAFGLHELGYAHILATDYSREMIRRARHLSKLLEYNLPLRVCDATDLEFEDNVFDGAIFGFNGLMQIPQAARRKQALSEIFRVIRPGAWFVLTTHDRAQSPDQDFWIQETHHWQQHEQSADLDDFGDRTESTPDGIHFMHVPSMQEMEALFKCVGFRIEVTLMRAQLTQEPAAVEAFSDNCRFWVVQKPDQPVHSAKLLQV